jgi:hypothetical protein
LTINGLTATQAIASQTRATGDTANFTPVTGSGGLTPYTYSISPALGNGLSINSTTGAITGTVTGTLAQTTYTVTVTDANNVTASNTFSLTINDFPNTIVLGTACAAGTISACGTLRNPVTVSGRTYYCWDMDNDGNCGNGAGDYRTHDVLDGFFNKDVNGASCGNGNTTDSCRYVNAATAGRKLALIPAGVTAGGVSTTCTGIPSTSDSLCGIRAASGNTNPSGWTVTSYWSSTVSSSGHYYVYFPDGGVYDTFGNNTFYVAVQVF